MLNLVVSIIVSFCIALLLMPILIKIAHDRKLFVPITYRRVHKGNVSSLGGIAVIIGTFFSLIIFEHSIDFFNIKYLFSAFVIMFLIGVRDDLQSVNAYIKLLGQLLVAILLVYISNFRIVSLQGLFGLDDLSFFQSNVVSIFLIILIINAYNFIDGIDLQASLIALALFIPLGIWFHVNDQIDYAILSLCLSGALMAFAIYNYPPSKIFLGDTGTMIIGLILSFVVIRFVNLASFKDIHILIYNPIVVFLGTFSIQILDVFRVAIMRIYKGNSPLKADKNHLHHLMLKLDWSQKKIAFVNMFLLLCMMFLNIFMQSVILNPNLQLSINIVIVMLLFMVIIQKVKAQKKLPKEI